MQKKPSILCGGNILNKYDVKLLSAAYRNLDEIYEYIATELNAKESAIGLIDQLEEAVLSLEIMPLESIRQTNHTDDSQVLFWPDQASLLPYHGAL
jgi:plasmid stabilization system protein ParE